MNKKIKLVSKIYKDIIEYFYKEGYYKSLAKSEEGNEQTFIEHSLKTLKYALCLFDYICELNKDLDTEENLKLLVIGALFHDINKAKNIPSEVDMTIEQLQYELSNIGYTDPYYARFVKAASIHKTREKQAATFRIKSEHSELVDIIRWADAMASVSSAEKVYEKLSKIVVDIAISYGLPKPLINLLKFNEIRLVITNYLIKAIIKLLKEQGQRIFAILPDGIIYEGSFKITMENADTILTFLKSSFEDGKVIQKIREKCFDSNKFRFTYQNFLHILDEERHIDMFRKIAEENKDRIYAKISSKYSELDLFKKAPDEIFITVSSHLFIAQQVIDTILDSKKSSKKVENRCSVVEFLMEEKLLSNQEVETVEKTIKQIEFPTGGQTDNEIVFFMYVADIVRKKIDNLFSFLDNFWNNFKATYSKLVNSNPDLANQKRLIEDDLKLYIVEDFLALSQNIFNNLNAKNKLHEVCPRCGRRVLPGTAFDKGGIIEWKYSFRLKPLSLTLKENGRLRHELNEKLLPRLCRICYIESILKNIEDISDTDYKFILYTPVDVFFNDQIIKFEEDLLSDFEFTRTTKKGDSFSYSIFNSILLDRVTPKILLQKVAELTKQVLDADEKLISSAEFNKFEVRTRKKDNLENHLRLIAAALITAVYTDLKVIVTDKSVILPSELPNKLKLDIKHPLLKKALPTSSNTYYSFEDAKNVLKMICSYYALTDITLLSVDEKDVISFIQKSTMYPLGVFGNIRFATQEERKRFKSWLSNPNIEYAVDTAISTIIEFMKGGEMMSIVQRLAETQLKFWNPSLSSSSYYFVLPFRKAVSVLKNCNVSNVEDLKAIIAGEINSLVERSENSQKVLAVKNKETLSAIEEYVSIIVDEIFQKEASAQIGKLSMLENYYSNALEYMIEKIKNENIKKAQERLKA
ncbi:HD domain-containing protein [Caldicellulosiruptor acetigenus]|uniref:Metal-dependent phosphohydrolase HD region n=1 Tax=Caldicellulosiruptor acetigenus 6A TaxID=632516 RepID=G2PT72_9FIRM|nr:HD domain-containing protein [Caldicellulosiruptor acetigenus]AEM74231.1 metal-dependent phosphohydrolase HD region [Caldicellulosiruptor acetigenus 6A]